MMANHLRFKIIPCSDRSTRWEQTYLHVHSRNRDREGRGREGEREREREEREKEREKGRERERERYEVYLGPLRMVFLLVFC